MTSIASRDVKMSFGSKEVLRGLSFDAKPSEVVYIVGSKWCWEKDRKRVV